ncbi:PREDICTED: uncharacterized protein LOC109211169 [Nicotiana attenuata]|uniref:uncharacterized protein LOC109211169 n=1 Tax=Nicotiana attenuata TaxID=49451 RepID=UPI0009055F4C|nr:PREDICTED: uncharacterized protein LOC109211169 [Nicotiana attenuata]
MRRLLETRTDDPSTRRVTAIGLIPMSVNEVGNGHCWPPVVSTWIPAEIVYDNGKQFIGSKVRNFFEDHKIKKILSTSYHPSGNGQAASTNKTILQNLKKILIDAKGKWKKILPDVLWAYRTTSKYSTGATPFSLVYGAKALIPIEKGELSLRFRYATEESNGESMSTSLELLDERREVALVRLAAQKKRI